MERRNRLTLWIAFAALAVAALVFASGPWRGGGHEESLQRGRSATPEPRSTADVASSGPWSRKGGEARGVAGTASAGDGSTRSAADGVAAGGREGTSMAGQDTPRVPRTPPRNRGTPPAGDSSFFSSGGGRSVEDESARRVAGPDESQADDEADDDENAGFSRVDLVALEEAAARAAEALGLVDPDTLERRIDDRVPSSLLTPTQLELARDAARRVILADAAIVEDLVRARYLATGSYRDANQARGFLETLLPAWGDDFRAQRLDGIAQRLLQ